MGSYTDAKAALREHLEDNWDTTAIAFPNEVPDNWPPTEPGQGGFATLLPFVFFEVATLPGQSIRGVGVPGDHLSQTRGFIYAHVFVPSGSGTDTATEYAEAIGELFRTKVLYESDGCYLRTWVPRVDEGGNGNADDDEIAPVNAGNYFRVTMSCPFEYWHQG